MKLHQAKIAHINQISSYGDGRITVNDSKYNGSMIVLPDCIEPWRPQCFTDLQAEDFAGLLQYRPEVVLLGTGSRLQFPHPRLIAALAAARVGVDAMDLGAMCRTFNVLAAEDRRVLALVLHG